LKTGVLVHSKYLQVSDWEKLMWGNPPDLLGEFPKAVLTALQARAIVMVLGCGLRSGVNGEMESECNRDYILTNFWKLADFSKFQGINLVKAKKKIESILVLDRESLNTAQEVKFSGILFEQAGVERVIAVTAPTHAPRCLNEALKFYGRQGSKIDITNVIVVSSNIGWTSNDEVICLEPSHRFDDPWGDIRHEIAKMLLRPDKLMRIKKALGL
jgi:hypothetical protein